MRLKAWQRLECMAVIQPCATKSSKMEDANILQISDLSRWRHAAGHFTVEMMPGAAPCVGRKYLSGALLQAAQNYRANKNTRPFQSR